MGNKFTILSTWVSAFLIDLCQALTPVLHTVLMIWVFGQFVAFKRVIVEVEVLFFVCVMEPDVFFMAIGKVLHAVFSGVAGGVFALHAVAPVFVLAAWYIE